MYSISEVTTTEASGLTSIDALLGAGPGWNWLMPIRDVIYFTFSTASGNLSGDNNIKGDVTAFNPTQ